MLENWRGSRTSTATRERLRETIGTVGPFAGLVATFLLTGWALRATIDLGTEPLMQYRLFFELIVAGFVISLLRSKVGLVTYGVFGPIIISYMLLESGVLWGTFLFVNLFLIALVTYVTIEPFNLGTAHRIGTMIVTVGIAITVIHLMADLRILPDTLDGLGVFFPAIITGWYADRFARDLNERGWRSPSIQFIWTIVSLLTAYLVLRNEALVSWFIHTPEAWVAVLVANVWFGSRGSLRLKEYLRFKRLFDRPAIVEFGAAIRTRLYNGWTYVARLYGSDREYVEESDVLAIRRRNQYINEYNPPELNPILDKVSMKKAFHDADVPTPETYLVVDDLSQLDLAEQLLEERDEFVIKPDSGYGGEGIVVVTGRTESGAYDTSKGALGKDDLLGHMRNIIEGQYAEMGLRGTVLIEQLIEPDDFLLDIAGLGVPDIRVIVFKGYPIMSMTRLPTEESDGAANLHMGAIGVGLSIADGRALGGYQSRQKWFETHPDTGVDLREFRIPDWDEILEVATHATAVSRLRYAGVDIVVDEELGPVVLEVNAHPGLGIQNATFEGTLERIDAIDSLPPSYELKSASEKIELAQHWDENDWEVPDDAE